jgi:hypothetical protein
MITLTAKIDLVSGGNIDSFSPSANMVGNNISSIVPIGLKKDAKRPFILGSSRLDGKSTFASSVDYFIGSQLSDENGVFLSPYTMVVGGEGLSSLHVAFDEANGAYPKKVVVDGVEYSDDDAIYSFKFSDSSIHTIEIYEWNKPNSPLIITGIYANINIDINRRNLLSMEAGVLEKAESGKPSFGIISNSGELSFRDTDGQVYDYITDEIINKNAKVEIFVNNTLANQKTKVAEFLSSAWNYEPQNRVVRVSLKDDFEQMQDIEINGFNYNPTAPFSNFRTMADVYEYLYSQTRSKDFKIFKYEDLDGRTKEILSNTVVGHDFLSSGSLWRQWDKLCKVCMLYLYKTKDGVITCSYRNGG